MHNRIALSHMPICQLLQNVQIYFKTNMIANTDFQVDSMIENSSGFWGITAKQHIRLQQLKIGSSE